MPRTSVLGPRGVAPAAASGLMWNGGIVRANSLLAQLLGYWGFDEGQGSVVNDLSGNGYTGTFNGTLTSIWSAGGILGNAGVFDGSTNFVSIPTLHENALALGKAFSASGWVFPTAFTNFGMLLTFGGTGIEMRHNGTTGVPQINVVGTTLAAPSALTLNAWTHEAITYDGGTLLYYGNGLPLASSIITLNPTPAAASFGARSTPADFWTGRLDEIAMWNRALSPAEIATLYNGGQAYRFL